MTIQSDILILGGGFSGSLTAAILQKSGFECTLVDRGIHPRFAIGESSTPIANLILSDLCDRYELPRIKPLTKYGSWKQTYPLIPRGPKRGFSYFQHKAGEPFRATTDHATELLVAASASYETSDTNWLRSAVDQLFWEEAASAGVHCLPLTNITQITSRKPWRLTAGDIEFEAKFVIDATGQARLLPRLLGLPSYTSSHWLKTNTRALYGHFENVQSWSETLQVMQIPDTDHPFQSEHSALHDLIDGG
ncbi:MAG: FAD-dependent oxidoreductase, partial [Planctomycetaceae bacterium]|nr:FAD-dependent oxidoreductase [Planctomycetaceae bacterium]